MSAGSRVQIVTSSLCLLHQHLLSISAHVWQAGFLLSLGNRSAVPVIGWDEEWGILVGHVGNLMSHPGLLIGLHTDKYVILFYFVLCIIIYRKVYCLLCILTMLCIVYFKLNKHLHNGTYLFIYKNRLLHYVIVLFEGPYIFSMLVWTTCWQDLCFPFTVFLPKQTQPFATRDSFFVIFLFLLKVSDKIFSPWFLNWWNTTHDVLPSAVPLMAAGSDLFSTLQRS